MQSITDLNKQRETNSTSSIFGKRAKSSHGTMGMGRSALRGLGVDTYEFLRFYL